jgi:hypothetical protein
MLHRAIDSFLTAVLLLILIPFVFFSALRSRVGLASPLSKPFRPHSSRQPAPPASEPIAEFQFDRAVEAYENLIDTVVAERRI